MKRTALKRTTITNKMTLAEYKESLSNGVKKHKYGASKQVGPSGESYDSTAEGDRHAELLLLEKAGLISGLEHHPNAVELVIPERTTRYHPDYAYQENGKTVFEDLKGVATQRWKEVKRAWAHSGPTVLRVTKGSKARGFRTVEEIEPGKAQKGPVKA